MLPHHTQLTPNSRLLQDSSRKLLQINDSATTVTAAPLTAAKANASILAPPSENGKPHSILADVISSFKSKFGKGSEAPAASATANATAIIISDGEGMSSSMDYYMEPCTDGPVPSAYEAFVQVNSQHLCLQLAAATATCYSGCFVPFSLHPCLAIFLTVCACGMPCICISTLHIISPRASTQHAALHFTACIPAHQHCVQYQSLHSVYCIVLYSYLQPALSKSALQLQHEA